MQGILVEGQHEDDQDEEGIEHCKEENTFVPQLFQSSSNKSLKIVK